MKIVPDPRVEKDLNKLNPDDKAKVKEYIELFKENGFGLTAKYLKKISNRVWELRPGTWRLFLLQLKPDYIIIYFMRKQSQKMTKKTIRIIEQRTKEYL